MSAEQIDFSKFKKPYELPHHWTLREDFLRLHYGKFDEDRLVCLSNIFINVECMGLSYATEVMDQVKELGKGIQSLQNYKSGALDLELEMSGQNNNSR